MRPKTTGNKRKNKTKPKKQNKQKKRAFCFLFKLLPCSDVQRSRFKLYENKSLKQWNTCLSVEKDGTPQTNIKTTHREFQTKNVNAIYIKLKEKVYSFSFIDILSAVILTDMEIVQQFYFSVAPQAINPMSHVTKISIIACEKATSTENLVACSSDVILVSTAILNVKT